MSLEEIFAKIEARRPEPITEIHIVGGCHPDLPFSFYLEMLQGIKRLRPAVHLQAFTAVEVAHLSDRAGLSVADPLLALKEAGLGSLPRRRRRGLQPPASGKIFVPKSSPRKGGWGWPKPPTAWGSTPMPPCSTAIWRYWQSRWEYI